MAGQLLEEGEVVYEDGHAIGEPEDNEEESDEKRCEEKENFACEGPRGIPCESGGEDGAEEGEGCKGELAGDGEA